MLVNPVPELYPTVDAGLPAFRRLAYRPRRPVVLRGGAGGWPALKRWTDDYLIEHVGDLMVRAYEMRRNQVGLDPRTGFRLRDLKVCDFLQELVAGDADAEFRYFMRVRLDGRLGPLLDDVSIPPYCAGGLELRRNLWMSGEGIVTQLHFDLPDNLICMVRGRKRFVVFAPAEREHLQPFPWLSSTPHLARLDPEAPGPDVGARGWTVDLEPGDILYLPPRFWHYARSLETALSVNHWWCRPVTRLLLAASDTYKRLRGLEI